MYQKIIKDPNFKINEDGTIFSLISRNGRLITVWRKITSFKKFKYYKQEVSIPRLIFSKFKQELLSGYTLKHLDGNIENNHINNLFCPQLAPTPKPVKKEPKTKAIPKMTNSSLPNKIKAVKKYNNFLKENGIKEEEFDLSQDLRTQKKKTYCSSCNNIFEKTFGLKNKYCSKYCMKASVYLASSFINLTVGQIKSKFHNKQNFRKEISNHAKYTFGLKNKERFCSECNYSEYVEVCHRKPVREFLNSDLISEVNKESNLQYLCPNHHTKLDKKTYVLKRYRDEKKSNRPYINKIGELEVQDRTKPNGRSNKYDSIRNNARFVIINSTRPLCCGICQEDEVLEICHIKAISEFSPTSLINDVNSLSNLVLLCPNHHYSMDHNKLSPNDQIKLDQHKKEFNLFPANPFSNNS